MRASGNQNESFEAPNQPPLCANNCGFFANPNGSGLCSKCFQNQHLARQEQEKRTSDLATETAKNVAALVSTASAQAARPLNPTPALADDAAEVCTSSAAVPMDISVEQPSTSSPLTEKETPAPAAPSPAPKTNRCQACRKKVGLNGFACRCGQTFCSQHRYAEAHSCTFDYKTMERRKLAETNPLVQASKIQKL